MKIQQAKDSVQIRQQQKRLPSLGNIQGKNSILYQLDDDNVRKRIQTTSDDKITKKTVRLWKTLKKKDPHGHLFILPDKVYYDEDGNVSAYDMKRFSGKPLSQLLVAQNSQLQWKGVIDHIPQLIRALYRMKKVGYHNDFSQLTNLLYDSKDGFRIIDFDTFDTKPMVFDLDLNTLVEDVPERNQEGPGYLLLIVQKIFRIKDSTDFYKKFISPYKKEITLSNGDTIYQYDLTTDFPTEEKLIDHWTKKMKPRLSASTKDNGHFVEGLIAVIMMATAAIGGGILTFVYSRKRHH
jgi:thiamine kinase-like enzyme